MDSDDDTQTGLDTDVQIRRRKRTRVLRSTDTEEEEVPTHSARFSAARRGKTISKGRLSGLARASEDLSIPDAANKDEEELEELFRSRPFHKSRSAPILDLEDISPTEEYQDLDALPADELRATADRKAAVIFEVARKSGNLKGPLIKRLKDSAAALKDIVETLSTRTQSEENRILRASNKRLQRQLDDVRAELKAYRGEVAELRTAVRAIDTTAPRPGTSKPFDEVLEEFKASMISSVGVMVDAKLAGIMERLPPEKTLRPPLAADRPALTTEKRPTSSGQTSRRKRNKGANNQQVPLQPETNSSAIPADAPSSQTWANVVQRNKKKKKASNATAAATSAPKTKPKVKEPKTAAVVLSLEPRAEKKGITYAHCLRRAAEMVNLGELGIKPGLSIRRSATGTRVLELPKACTQEQAEQLAEKLSIALDGVATAVRAETTRDLKITGLDDAVTEEDITEAIAKFCNCKEESLRVRKVHPGPGGMGMTTVRCPVVSAKLLVEAGRVLVGLSSAKVVALERRPLRCFRCLGIGHTRAMCPALKDRSSLCFRCGEEGHKIASCTNKLRCAVCADSGKPHAHVTGGRKCHPPKIKGRTTISAAESTRVPDDRPTTAGDMSP